MSLWVDKTKSMNPNGIHSVNMLRSRFESITDMKEKESVSSWWLRTCIKWLVCTCSARFFFAFDVRHTVIIHTYTLHIKQTKKICLFSSTVWLGLYIVCTSHQ